MIEGLNEKQSQAALTIDGPVIVFAGAGSGKTRTLTYRIMNMIVNEHIDPYHILAITFTNKATNVMKERLSSYLDVNIKGITISTFHSLCASILRKEIPFLGYNRDFDILDEEEQLKVIDEVLKEKAIDKKRNKYFQKTINFHKCFMTKPNETIEDTEVYEAYEEKMKELNMLDFEDLLLKTYEIFSTSEDILRKYQDRFKYILVDEFQDTNLVQYKIVKLLALTNRNLFVVGDDDQSIYSFRGTNYENMNLFKEDFPEYQLFTLDENYRSTQAILDVANRLIANNKNREPKTMVTSIEGSMNDVETIKLDNGLKEIDYVVDKIISYKKALNNYTDFAILYRSSALLRQIELNLIQHQIPYKVYGGVSYLRRKEVKDIIAYFRLMLNPDDTLSFKRIINVPARGIGLATIDKIETIHKRYRVDYFKAIEMSEEILPASKFELLNNFKELIKEYALRLEDEYLLDIFDNLVSDIHYYKYLKDEYEKTEAEERIDNINEFKSILYGVEHKEPDRAKLEKLKEALDDAVLSDDHLQNQRENKNGVTVSTIHSVKGLEYEYVFIVGMEENIFPNERRLLSSAEMEEERRIAYVAMTRAKSHLIMTYTKQRLLYGSIYQNKPSRFLLEALGVDSMTEYVNAEVVNEKKQLESKYQVIKENAVIHVDSDTGFKISDKIVHAKFGEGIILGMDNGIGNIFFTELKQTKKILLNHPSIKKL